MIHEVHQGLGRWQVPLDPATPDWVMNRVNPKVSLAANVVITAAQVPIELQEGILDVARYTGVLEAQPNDFTIAGKGLAYYIGDDNDVGKWFTAGSPAAVGAPGALSAWTAYLLPEDLTLGFVGSQTGHVYSYSLMTRKEILVDVMSRFGTEWRIRPNGVMDFGAREDLFRMVPRTTILAKRGDASRGLQMQGIEGELELERDGRDYARRVYLYNGTALVGSPADGGVSDANVPYRAFRGSPIQRDKKINATASAPAGAAAADFEKNRYIRQEITLSSEQYDIGDGLEVGDNVYVFDSARSIQDLSNQITGPNGQLIFPEVIRCVELEWPIRQGMGVYFRRWVNVAGTWTVEWTDLTPYVKFENRSTQVKVGARPRPIKK